MAAAAATVTALPRNVVKLSKTITTHKGQSDRIEFAEPTAALFIRHKRLPFTVATAPDGSQSIATDFQLAAAYITDLTALDDIVLGQLSPGDFAACLNKLAELLNSSGN